MIISDHPQGSEGWLLARLGVPSSSNFSRMVTGTGKPSAQIRGYASELASELFAGKSLDDFDGNTWMQRGKEMEQEAVNWYEFTHDLTAQRVGFCTRDDGLAGCSPDALIGDDAGLEIKCLKAERHIEARTYFEKHGKCQPTYTPQVQGSLWVTGRKRWTLLFYSRDLPPLEVPITPDAAYHEMLEKAVRQCCTERDEILTALRRDQQEVPAPRDTFMEG